MPEDELDLILESNWGKNWQEKFEYFDKKPFAATSIGQVHKAVTKEGKELAIKIQFLGVEQSIDSDLKSIGYFLNTLRLLPKSFYLDHFLHTVSKELREECDYLKEKEKLENFQRLLRENKIDNNFIIPEVDS